jgi:hypothetical protein
VCLWDIGAMASSPIIRVRSHRGSVTGVVTMGGAGASSSSSSGGYSGGYSDDISGSGGSGAYDGCFLTCGVDGMVKGWDTRCQDGRPVFEIPAHAGVVTTTANARSFGAAAGGAGAGSVLQKKKGQQISSSTSTTTTKEVAAAAVACMATLPSRGSGPVGLVVTGGADGAVCLLDARFSTSSSSSGGGGGGGGGGGVHGVLDRWEHHRLGVYSLCAISDDCVLSADGAGMMHAYQCLSSPADRQSRDRDSAFSYDHSGSGSGSSTGALKYGLGASSQGAVRAIMKAGDNKIATGGEDGKALIFTY